MDKYEPAPKLSLAIADGRRPRSRMWTSRDGCLTLDTNGRSAPLPNRRAGQNPRAADNGPAPSHEQRPSTPTVFRVVGEGPQAAEPIELIALTATEAETHCSKLRRLCGRAGKVEVLGKGGTKVSPARLRRLALAESQTAAMPTQDGAHE